MPGRKTKLICSLLFLFFVSTVYFAFLDFSPVFQISEGREGVVVLTMLETHELVLPLRSGVFIPSKPPLFHWIGYSLARVFGLYNEFLLRTPSAIAGLLVSFSIFLFLKRAFGLYEAVFGCLAILSTFGFYRLSGDGRVDMVFSACVIGAVLVWLDDWVQSRKNSSNQTHRISHIKLLLIAILSAGAVLGKGPLGLALVCFILLCLSYSLGGVSSVLRLLSPVWLFAILIPGLWYFAAFQRMGEEFLLKQMIFENVTRLTGGKGIDLKPFWFYLAHGWTQAAPWSFVALLLFFYDRSRKQMAEVSFVHGEVAKGALVWILSTVFLLSCSAGKRRGYLVPALPAVSLYVVTVCSFYSNSLFEYGSTLGMMLRRGAKIVFFFTLSLLVVIYGLSFAFDLSTFTDSRSGTLMLGAIDTSVFKSPLRVLFLLLSAFVAVPYVWTNCARSPIERKRVWGQIISSTLFIFLMLVYFVSMGLSARGIVHTHRESGILVRKRVADDETLTIVKKKRDESFDGFLFYYRRPVKFQSVKEPIVKAGWYIFQKDWLKKVSPGEGIEVKEILQTSSKRKKPAREWMLVQASEKINN
jgi:4-amino-4-deoxy-L-arabinose transferase-like glycosyltransferase